MPSQTSLDKAIRLWDSLQVELHGQYSIARFEALLQYEARYASKLRALAVALLTVLPCLLVVFSTDALPLVPPSEGHAKQTYAYWVRIIVIGWLMPFTLILQFCIIAPSLPMSPLRHWAIAIVIAGTICVLDQVCVLLVGFPIPFSIEFQAGPFLTILAATLWFSWKDVLRNDTPTREMFKRYIFVFGTQVTMLQVYIGFNLAFNQLQGHQQTLLCGLLPFIKLFFKNCVGWATFHLEDLSPTIAIFTIDMYHALFVSFTMQQASATGANAVVMVVDVVQNYIAYMEISRVLTIINTCVEEDKQTVSVADRRHYSASDMRLKVSVIDYASYLLKTHEGIRDSAEIALPRHLRQHEGTSNQEMMDFRPTTSRVVPVAACSGSPQFISTSLEKLPPEGSMSGYSSPHTRRHVVCTRAVLKLLYMTEFYVLVEFIEVMFTVFYAVYMTILSYLPSRSFYMQLSHLSAPQLRVSASHVGGFAVAEFLSLVIFCVVVDRKIKHFSTLRQLAFALETNWKLIQALIVAWVFLSVQQSLEHFGADYTFQFKWLRHNSNSTII